MALRGGLLVHQLLLALASASFLVAAGLVDHATPPFPDDGASMADSSGTPPPCAADSSGAPPPCASDDDADDGVLPLLAASSVHATPPCAEDDAAASAADSCVRHAAGPVDHATPPFPDYGASAADDSSRAPPLLLAHATPPCRDVDDTATSAADSTVVFHGARRLGLQSSDLTAGAAAPAPNHPDGPRRHLFLDILAVILFVILVCFIAFIVVAALVGIGFVVYHYGGGRVVASFVADNYARARARWTAARNKASQRVHPAAQQQDAGGP